MSWFVFALLAILVAAPKPGFAEQNGLVFGFEEDNETYEGEDVNDEENEHDEEDEEDVESTRKYTASDAVPIQKTTVTADVMAGNPGTSPGKYMAEAHLRRGSPSV